MTTQFVIVKSHKSTGIAILLTLLFGPIGLFYASVAGGIILTFVVPAILIILIFAGAIQSEAILLASLIFTFVISIFYWLICIIWAIIAVQDYNKQLDEDFKRQQILNSSYNTTQSYSNFSSPTESKQHIVPSQVNSNIPSLQEWLKENPGRAIHDYYTKFGRSLQ